MIEGEICGTLDGALKIQYKDEGTLNVSHWTDHKQAFGNVW
ncbi:MAG TPA: hypothetical protein VFG54_18940 [Prolixibacteraceae bacterium]|nr:hypothetical protein [Prolixibacteraceae bacterium]